MALVAITPPRAEPVSLVEAKAHLNVDISADDTLITGLIAAARAAAENIAGRAMVLQTWDLVLDGFPSGATCPIEIPLPPLRSVTSISYIDVDGVTQTWAAADYTVDTSGFKGRILPAYSEVWPTTRDVINSVTVRFVAGYATPFTANAGTDVITGIDHPYADGDKIRLATTDGDLPAGLSTLTDYYVRDVSGDTFKVETSVGGGAVDITDAGTGTHFAGVMPENMIHAILMMAAHWYQNRENAMVGVSIMDTPQNARWLLEQDKVYL